MHAETEMSAPAMNKFPLLLGPDSTILDCPFCKKYIITNVKYTSHTGTHMAAAHWAPLCCMCCVPYYLKSAKNANHYCPSCQRYLGTYRT